MYIKNPYNSITKTYSSIKTWIKDLNDISPKKRYRQSTGTGSHEGKMQCSVIKGLALKLDPEEIKQNTQRCDLLHMEHPHLCGPAMSHSFYLKEIEQHMKIGHHM